MRENDVRVTTGDVSGSYGGGWSSFEKRQRGEMADETKISVDTVSPSVRFERQRS